MATVPHNHEDLIRLLGLEDLGHEEKLKVIDQVTEVLELRVLERAYQQLSSAQRTELQRRFEQSPQSVLEYLQGSVTDFENIVTEELQKIRKELFTRKESAREEVEQELADKGL